MHFANILFTCSEEYITAILLYMCASVFLLPGSTIKWNFSICWPNIWWNLALNSRYQTGHRKQYPSASRYISMHCSKVWFAASSTINNINLEINNWLDSYNMHVYLQRFFFWSKKLRWHYCFSSHNIWINGLHAYFEYHLLHSLFRSKSLSSVSVPVGIWQMTRIWFVPLEEYHSHGHPKK